MARHLQLLVVMYISVLTKSLKDGEGVCNKTEMQTELKTIQQELIVGTTEVPCIIRSFIDQLSCGNRGVQTKNVTERINKTVEVFLPVTTWFCCEGYAPVKEQCIIKTTVGTTQKETTLPTTRTEVTTHVNVDLTTETNVVTTQTQTERYHTTPIETHMLATDTITTEDFSSSGDEAFTFILRDTTVNIGVDGVKVTKDKTFAGVEVSSEATVISNGVDLRDILLYVFAACALLFFVAMVLVIFAFHRRSRKNKKSRFRSERTTTLAMDDIIQNGNRITRIHSGDYCTEINENASNAYTEMNRCGESQYDELKNVDEDPYEELPDCDDYDDCDASPRLQKSDKTMKVFTK